MQNKPKHRRTHWSWVSLLALLLTVSACDEGSNKEGEQTASTEITAKILEPKGLKAIKVSTAYHNSFVLMNDGTVRAWGQSQHGQLGKEVPPSFGDTANDRVTPVQIAITDVVALESSHGSTGFVGSIGSTLCALKKDSSVWCWGENDMIPLEGVRDTATPMEIPSFKGAKKIAMGLGHACVLMSDETIQCWGSNYNGELGVDIGTKKSSDIPVKVPELTGVVDIALGTSHTCVALKTGDVKCWGRNKQKQISLAKDSAKKITKPQLVEGITGAVSVMASDDDSCALDQAGALKCWGDYRDTIVHIANDVLKASGFNEHMCILKIDHTVHCWGDNDDGQLGQGKAREPYDSKIPLPVVGIVGAVDVSVSYDHSCVVLKEGNVKCWGINKFGELGDGTYIDRAAPVEVKGVNAEVLPEASSGFGTANVPDLGVEQLWVELPKSCTYAEILDVKHNIYHQETFKVLSAGAKRSPNGNIYITVANFKIHNKDGYAPYYRPRGDQAQVLIYVKKVNDRKAEDPEAQAVDAGKYVFSKADAENPRTMRGSLSNAHTNFYFRYEEDTLENKVELTYVGEDWVCGAIDFSNEKGHVKGTFAAKFQK